MRYQDLSKPISEVSMTPSDFARAIETAPSERVLIGFEFEVCVPLTQQEITVKDLSKDDLRKLILNASEDTIVTEENIDVLSKLIQLKRPVPSAPGVKTLQELYKRSREVAIAQARDFFNQQPEKDRQYELDYIKNYYPERMENEYRFAQLIVRRFDNSRLEYVMANRGDGSNIELYALLALASKHIADINSENFDIDYRGMVATFPAWKHRFEIITSTLTSPLARYQRAAAELKPQVAQAMGAKVNVFNEYHEKNKNLNDWYIEPDGSLRPNQDDASAEIVSPPLLANRAMEALKNFYGLAQGLKLYTNDSTGLHINMSIPKKLDPMKLALFLGDEHVLRQFGREANEYADSVIKSLKRSIDIDSRFADTMVKTTGRRDPNRKNKLGPGVQQTLREKILRDLAKSVQDDHTASISNNGKYISFRHAGGNYLADYSKVVDTVGRFARAMMIASDPNAYRQEYLTKLYKLATIPPSTPRTDVNDVRGAVIKLSKIYRDIATNGAWASALIVASDVPGPRLESMAVNQLDRYSLRVLDIRPIAREQALQQLTVMAGVGAQHPAKLIRLIKANPAEGYPELTDFMAGSAVNYLEAQLNMPTDDMTLYEIDDILTKFQTVPSSMLRDLGPMSDYLYVTTVPTRLSPTHPESRKVLAILFKLYRRLGQLKK